MQKGFTYHIGVVVWLAVLCSACTAPESERKWHLDLNEADRLVDNQQYDAAIAAYQELFLQAPDELQQRYITYRLGLIEERRENWGAAVELYTQLLEHHRAYIDEDEYIWWVDAGLVCDHLFPSKYVGDIENAAPSQLLFPLKKNDFPEPSYDEYHTF